MPTWSSSTSYYAGRRDGGWDDAGPHDTTERAAPVTQRNDYPPGYAPRYAPQPPPPQSHQPPRPNGYAGNGQGNNGGNGRGSNSANGYVPDGYANEWGSPTQVRPDEYDDRYDDRYDDSAPSSAYPSRSATRAQARATTNQRGLPGWGALVVLLAIAGIGDLIDTIAGNTAQGGFNIAIVVASIVAILLVRHRDMFPIVVAPPLVYFISSAGMLYLNSGGLHNRKSVIDHAANWLVYGFPAIAGASAAVLIIAGVRLVIGK